MSSPILQPHTPVTHTWQHSQARPTLHDPPTAYGLAGMPDFAIPQPPTSLASPFHPGTTLPVGSRSKGDRFHDVRKLFAKRELERQNSVATRDGAGKRCFCEKELEDEEDIYCSSACARTDAMSSLCFAETRVHTAESSISSLSSISSAVSSTTPRPPSQTPLSPSQASHYRRITSDLVKRRAAHSKTGYSSRRRGTSQAGSSIGSMASVVSTNISRVPELVGGHSRNVSAASVESGSSRYPSIGARGGTVLAEITQSGLGDRGLMNVKEEMEDDIERLADAEEDHDAIRPHSPRRGSLSFATLNNALSHPDTAFGMGQDMQDVLDEIIMMEKGFNVHSSESEDDSARPRTPLVRESGNLPTAPRRAAHHSNDSGPTPQTRPRHIPSRSEPSLAYVPASTIMSQLPSAFEDANEEDEDPDFSSLAEGRRSFTRRSRSEIRRSLTFIPPKGYRASLLASIKERAPDARAGAHPYRRSVVAGNARVDDSVTRFQFPRMPEVETGQAMDTASPVRAPEEDPPVGLEPALFPASPILGVSPDALAEPQPELEPIVAPSSGLRLGVLLGSGVDDDDAWFRSRRTAQAQGDDMDVESP